MSEDDLIERIRRLFPRAGDDCAVVGRQVLTTDMLVEGVDFTSHFAVHAPARLLARKSLAVNLSDLAAKGATPLGFLLTLALPEEVGDAWLAPFARGLGADVQAFGCPLLGGDTDRTSGPITISIAVIGAVPQGRMVRRAGAQAGDRVVVEGFQKFAAGDKVKPLAWTEAADASAGVAPDLQQARR